jgi:hypothetical protein
MLQRHWPVASVNVGLDSVVVAVAVDVDFAITDVNSHHSHISERESIHELNISLLKLNCA